MKPSQEQINDYSKKLEELLTAQNWKIEIISLESPLEIPTQGNGEFEQIWWLNEVAITFQDGEVLTLPANFAGLIEIEENLTPQALWDNAYMLQNAVYLKKSWKFSVPIDESDPYWELWGKRNKK